MHCHACGSENRADVRFCEQCGTLLKGSNTRICPACGHKNAGSAQFCEQCGHTLAANDKKRRVWLWGLLGMLLALVLCCFSFLLLPQPPPDEQTFLPSVVDAGWQTAVQRREVGLQSSGWTGSLLRAGSAIIPQPVSQAVGDLIRQAAGGDIEELSDDRNKDGEPILNVVSRCSPYMFDKNECEAAGGILAADQLSGQFCNCPGEDKNGELIRSDKEWCLAEGGSWSDTYVYRNGIGDCSFYNQCNDIGEFDNKADPCSYRGGLVECNDEGDCRCFCPNPDFAGLYCKALIHDVEVVSGPTCIGGPKNFICSIEMKNTPSDNGGITGAVLKFPGNKQDAGLQSCMDLETTGTFICKDYYLEPDQNAEVIWCSNSCCFYLGEMEVQIDQTVARNLAAPTEQTCCQNVRARNVKYFRDPPGIGALYLGFDMQCADANWQLGSQCASFDALVGASRNIPWTSGACCPDPNYPDRLNCSGSIEGQKKSMTQIVMTYGSCTAEAEFQSPYQAPVEQSDSTSQPKPPSDSGSSCPSGQSLCGGVCCSSVNCYYDSINDSYSCKP